jgi:hypothetical protein
MKPTSSAYIYAFIMLFMCSGSVFGISPEAKEEIEKLRAKLTGVIVAKKEAKKVSDKYVPGRNLAKALSRLRQMLRRGETTEQLVLQKLVNKASPLKSDKEYIPGKALKNRLAQLKSLRTDRVLVASIKPALAAKKKKEEVKIKVKAKEINTEKPKVVAPEPKKIEKPHKLVKATKTRKRKPKSSKQPRDNFRDKEFNADIRRFEFKMPDNYRIIVR